MLGLADTRPLTKVLPAKVAAAITRAWGYRTCGEFVTFHLPRHYLKQSQGMAEIGENASITGTITNVSTRHTTRGEIFAATIDNHVEAVFFGGWQRHSLQVGTHAFFVGKLGTFNNRLQLQHPDFLILNGESIAKRFSGHLKAINEVVDIEKLINQSLWLPIYPATSTLRTWTIMGAIHLILSSRPEAPDPFHVLPLSFDRALRTAHAPGPAGADEALAALKYYEAFSVGLVMNLRKRDSSQWRAHPLPACADGFKHAMVEALPYSLTAGQRRVEAEIASDITGNAPMMRLLQGEVGSGKTVVAVLAMLQAVDQGKQAALLAPTEVLAHQHARSISQLLPTGVNLVVLSGSMKTAEKRKALLDIVSGEADIVVGTHAIIQDSVEFFDLAMVVIDEQHRFGVEQREQLRTKARDGFFPHTLVMTATPIPRTVAITVFGDLEISALTELPRGRQPIQTTVVPEAKGRWVQRAWERIQEEIENGRQAYIVCPRIDGEGGVVDMTRYLQTGPLAQCSIASLHGRMEDKDAVMEQFGRGEIDVLVSTTVIEVGVDVPNATVMMIREAENFGVSQLHQLRGRVGRGGNASLCLLHTMTESGSAAYLRLEEVAHTTSGFALAELDMKYRHEGDVFGTRQSGRSGLLRQVSIKDDADIIEKAYSDATGVVARDPQSALDATAEVRRLEQEYLQKA
ncbi:MAG: ATP-dependent DNA helicase RecG [Corynebacterium sp.]|nr:ATP-dependent DNA helicase RecG [Corynebacterium sp.]